MGQQSLVGIVAGLAGALLFASMASGSLLSFALFYLAPLPLMIAALGWSHLAGLIAAIVASVCLAAAFGPWFFLGFLVGVGLPACWLAYLALLARPAGTSPEGLEWYPVGRLVVWSAVLGALIVALAIPTFGTDAESFRAGLKAAFRPARKLSASVPKVGMAKATMSAPRTADQTTRRPTGYHSSPSGLVPAGRASKAK